MGFSYKKTINYFQESKDIEGYTLLITSDFPNYEMHQSKIRNLSQVSYFLDNNKETINKKIASLSSDTPSEKTKKDINKLSAEITNITNTQENIEKEISDILEKINTSPEDEFYNKINEYDYSLYTGSELFFSTPIETKEYSNSEFEEDSIERVTINAGSDYCSVDVTFIDRAHIPKNTYTLSFAFCSSRFGECKRVELLYNDSDGNSNIGYARRLLEWHRTDVEFYDDDQGYWDNGESEKINGSFILEAFNIGIHRASISAFVNTRSGIKRFESVINISDGDNFRIFIKTSNSHINETTDVGFIISDQYCSLDSFENEIFTKNSPSYSRELFRELNAGTIIRPGSMLILAVDQSFDQNQMAQLMHSRNQVNYYLDLIAEQKTDHNFFYKNYQTLANFLTIAEKGTDLAGVAGSEYFKQIDKIIKNINILYKSSFESMGAITGDVFYAQRRQLFSKLDTLLKTKFLLSTMKLPKYSKMKNTLSLSTKSIVHHWKASGVTDLPGYSTHIAQAAKMNTIMKRTGYAGIAFSGLGSINTIYKSCSSGRENECEKTTFTEIGSFSLGTVGGTGLPALCLALSFTPFGAIACSVILSLTGSTLGSIAGEYFGNKIYEAKNDK